MVGLNGSNAGAQLHIWQLDAGRWMKLHDPRRNVYHCHVLVRYAIAEMKGSPWK